MFYLRDNQGRAHGLFGWTDPALGLHYATAADAEAARQQSPALASCEVARVAPVATPGTQGFYDPHGLRRRS